MANQKTVSKVGTAEILQVVGTVPDMSEFFPQSKLLDYDYFCLKVYGDEHEHYSAFVKTFRQKCFY